VVEDGVAASFDVSVVEGSVEALELAEVSLAVELAEVELGSAGALVEVEPAADFGADAAGFAALSVDVAVDCARAGTAARSAATAMPAERIFEVIWSLPMRPDPCRACQRLGTQL